MYKSDETFEGLGVRRIVDGTGNVAWVLWLLGGWFGLHRIWLGQRHGFIRVSCIGATGLLLGAGFGIVLGWLMFGLIWVVEGARLDRNVLRAVVVRAGG